MTILQKLSAGQITVLTFTGVWMVTGTLGQVFSKTPIVEIKNPNITVNNDGAPAVAAACKDALKSGETTVQWGKL